MVVHLVELVLHLLDIHNQSHIPCLINCNRSSSKAMALGWQCLVEYVRMAITCIRGLEHLRQSLKHRTITQLWQQKPRVQLGLILSIFRGFQRNFLDRFSLLFFRSSSTLKFVNTCYPWLLFRLHKLPWQPYITQPRC